jgi:hypothetical protein
MDREKLESIIKSLEFVVSSLKEELSASSISRYEEITKHLTDYDEVFYEDDD